MLLGLGIPTCREGVAYSPGFASPLQILTMARAARAAGYDAVWGNQHLLTQQAIAATAEQPPNYYDPLMIMSYLAGLVDEVQLVFGTLVAPAHHPLILAKQLATLDHLSGGGRVVAGLGVGTYVEEAAALARPGTRRPHRGRLLDELIAGLRVLFAEHSASFRGTEFEFDNVQSYPKPIGALPIFVSGDSAAGIERAAKAGDGWIMAARSPAEIVSKRELMSEALTRNDRADVQLQLAAQVWVCVGSDDSEAERRLTASQHFRRQLFMRGSTPSELIEEFRSRNLLGSVATIAEQVDEFRAAGVDHLTLIFLGDSVDDVVADADAVAVAVGERMSAALSGAPDRKVLRT